MTKPLSLKEREAILTSALDFPGDSYSYSVLEVAIILNVLGVSRDPETNFTDHEMDLLVAAAHNAFDNPGFLALSTENKIKMIVTLFALVNSIATQRFTEALLRSRFTITPTIPDTNLDELLNMAPTSD